MFDLFFSMQLHITDKCDQRCKHCYIYQGDKYKYINEDMPIDTFYEIIEDFKDCCKKMSRKPSITITGGDPLLYKDIWKLLSFLKKNDIQFVILGNPFHLNNEVAKRLKDLGCVNYQMSLDGLREIHDTIRKIGSFDETLEKISCLKNADIPVTIMTTVSKTNINTIPKLVDIIVEYKVNNFSFARYCPHQYDKDNLISSDEYREFLDKMWRKFEEHKDSNTRFMLKDHLWNLYLYEKGYLNLDNIKNENNLILDGCHCGISHITVLADGTVYACRRCDSPVGKVPKQSIYDIFFGENMNYYRQYDNFDECSKCKLRNICRGCPAVAKSVTGNFYAKDPQCWRTVIKDENKESSEIE